MIKQEEIQIYNEDCYGLKHLKDNTIDALITDPPYGIGFQDHDWDKGEVPKPEIWEDCFRVMKPGAFGLVFSFPRLMHRIMTHIEDRGFLLKDVLFWSYTNGMPKTRNIALEIDKEKGVESEIIGEYTYEQGYKKGGADSYKLNERKYKLKPASDEGKFFEGAGLGLKPAYEPIILIQKPIESDLTIAKNLIKHKVGVLNLEEARIPYPKFEKGKKIGHNPHPVGRVPANIIRHKPLNDGYDKYFQIAKGNLERFEEESSYQEYEIDENENFLPFPKVRQSKEEFNLHPTVKPIALMSHLVKLLSFKGQTILDPFVGSGSTALACIIEDRNFMGYEIDEEYYQITMKRVKIEKELKQQTSIKF
ncbi:MAG: site-specific DNA-methyltransferase [Microscillaceae bacterium]|nr:site-specific DNA-methyltransferase [Microscillaceae bacterium]